MSRKTPDPAAVGIGLAFAGMLVLTLTPVAGRWADIPPGLAVMALGAAMILILGGAAVGLLGGREASGRASDSSEPSGPDAPPGSDVRQ